MMARTTAHELLAELLGENPPTDLAGLLGRLQGWREHLLSLSSPAEAEPFMENIYLIYNVGDNLLNGLVTGPRGGEDYWSAHLADENDRLPDEPTLEMLPDGTVQPYGWDEDFATPKSRFAHIERKPGMGFPNAELTRALLESDLRSREGPVLHFGDNAPQPGMRFHCYIPSSAELLADGSIECGLFIRSEEEVIAPADGMFAPSKSLQIKGVAQVVRTTRGLEVEARFPEAGVPKWFSVMDGKDGVRVFYHPKFRTWDTDSEADSGQ
jgi:hypothetical protein